MLRSRLKTCSFGRAREELGTCLRKSNWELVDRTSSLRSLLRRPFAARVERGLRLENLTEARVLAAVHTGSPSGVSASHERAVQARLQRRGWIGPSGRLVETRSVVSEALLVEAKIKDWRGGMGQVVRNRWAYSGAALLLPAESHQRVPRRTLRHNGVGLLVLEDGHLRWQIRPTWKPLSWLASTWITELLLRDLESRTKDSLPA